MSKYDETMTHLNNYLELIESLKGKEGYEDITNDLMQLNKRLRAKINLANEDEVENSYYLYIIDNFIDLTKEFGQSPKEVILYDIGKFICEIDEMLSKKMSLSRPISKGLKSAMFGTLTAIAEGAAVGATATPYVGGMGGIPGAAIGAVGAFGATLASGIAATWAVTAPIATFSLWAAGAGAAGGGLIGSTLGYYVGKQQEDQYESNLKNNLKFDSLEVAKETLNDIKKIVSKNSFSLFSPKANSANVNGIELRTPRMSGRYQLS